MKARELRTLGPCLVCDGGTPGVFDRLGQSHVGACVLCGAIHALEEADGTLEYTAPPLVYGVWIPLVVAYYRETGNRIGHTQLDPASQTTAPEMERWMIQRLDFVPTPWGLFIVEAGPASGEQVLKRVYGLDGQPAERMVAVISASDLPLGSVVFVTSGKFEKEVP